MIASGSFGVLIVDSSRGRRSMLESWLAPVPELFVVAPPTMEELCKQIRRFDRAKGLPGALGAVLLGDEVWLRPPAEKRWHQPDPWRYWILELTMLMGRRTGLLVCTSELEEEHRAVQEYCTRNGIKYGWAGWTKPEKIEDLLLTHLEGLSAA